MTWIAPMTAVAGSVFTAAQFNTFVRDLLNETAPAKATTPGSHFVATGTNQIAERIPAQASVNTSESTASTTFVNLTTPGPSVTVTTGSSALIVMSAEIHNGTASEAGRVQVADSHFSDNATDVLVDCGSAPVLGKNRYASKRGLSRKAPCKSPQGR